MVVTLAWAIAAEVGALVALGSGRSTSWTLFLAGFGTLWLAIILAFIEVLAERVPTDETGTHDS